MFARNWSVGAEYLYVDLGTTTLTLAPVAGGVIGVTNFFFNSSTASFDDRQHVARVKLNYHFGGPVVARLDRGSSLRKFKALAVRGFFID